MLVNLTPIPSEIERCKKIAKENDFEYRLKWILDHIEEEYLQ